VRSIPVVKFGETYFRGIGRQRLEKKLLTGKTPPPCDTWAESSMTQPNSLTAKESSQVYLLQGLPPLGWAPLALA